MFVRACVYKKLFVPLHAFYGLLIKTDNMDEMIRHEGVVLATDGKTARVTILQASACQACKAQSMCMSADSKEKEMDVILLDAVKPGDRVEVMVEEHLAWKAVFLAYILPFLVMMCVLVVLCTVTDISDSIIGSVALGSIALYYLCLAMFKYRLKRHFTFKTRKL